MSVNQDYQQWNQPLIKDNEILMIQQTYFDNFQDQQLIHHKQSADSTLEQFYQLCNQNINSSCKFHYQEQHDWRQLQERVHDRQNYHNKIILEEAFEFHNTINYNQNDTEEHAYEIQFVSYEIEQEKIHQIKTVVFETIPKISKIKSKSNDRKFRVDRYLLKKARRCFIKKISYECRKTVADKRVRVKGRFVKKSQIQSLKFNNPQDTMQEKIIQFNKPN